MVIDLSEKAHRLKEAAQRVFACMIVFMTLIPSAVKSEGPDSGTFVDSRDGKEYKWVRIGSQVWMAENLRFVPESGWKCWNDNEADCAKRGVFYDWETASKASPSGWHLPSDEEWKTLERELGVAEEELDLVGLDRKNNAGATIKKQDCWPIEFDGRPVVYSNETGFSAVPTGFFALGEFTHSGYGCWWTGTSDGEKAWVKALNFHNNTLTRAENEKKFYFPVRCVRNKDRD